ncbi:TRAP transporter substrate-binding protein [Marispirochaeta aestuarii]|uniref:TRAP transporter substrate-binding protein n=1 Tax=Marispirochaeta aestuarii TaxID=1963862 RepID=UPI0029C75798|nr:TRAP transporter substrate-binding protein [Marispirochaeta aestuarii]
MKKLGIVLVVLLIGAFVFANGQGEDAGQKAMTLRVTNTLPLDHPMNMALQQFAKGVAERTAGQVKVELFPNSQLGGNEEMVEGVQLGTIDMCNQFAGAFANYVPEMEVLALAFLFQSEDHLYASLNGKAGDILAKALLKKGFVPLGYFYGGSRSLMNNVRPINRPSDLNGLKIRTIPTNITLEGINRMGAIATPMSQADVYSALEQGVLDGWENSPITLYTLKLYEVTDYVSWTRHFMTPDLFAISAKTWGKLSDDQKKIITEEAQKAVAYERSIWAENTQKAIDALKAEGVEFNDVADLDAFRKATSSLWNEYEDKYKNGLIDAVLSAAK